MGIERLNQPEKTRSKCSQSQNHFFMVDGMKLQFQGKDEWMELSVTILMIIIFLCEEVIIREIIEFLLLLTLPSRRLLLIFWNFIACGSLIGPETVFQCCWYNVTPHALLSDFCLVNKECFLHLNSELK